ncbi:hypothetical protein STENM327S_05618 [Streptomyces tendae]
MLRMYCERSPNSETSQNEPPSRRPPTGVRRGRPETRPVVSRRVWPGSRRTTAFSRRWKAVTVRYFRSGFGGFGIVGPRSVSLGGSAVGDGARWPLETNSPGRPGW